MAVFSPSTVTSNVSIVSYNMHGYNQGITTVRDLIDSLSPDIFLLQEHWLTPANMSKFDTDASTFYAFGSSAMSDAVASGPLYGRPYGGVMVLIKKNLMSSCECIIASERYAAIKLGETLIFNVYMPCRGTLNRSLLYGEILNEILVWRQKYPDHSCVIAGDFNVTLDCNSEISQLVNDFLVKNDFIRCDINYPNTCQYTYVNESLAQYSKIDYFVCNNFAVNDFQVLESEVNFSDHLPLLLVGTVKLVGVNNNNKNNQNECTVSYLRWDRGDKNAFYSLSFQLLSPFLTELDYYCKYLNVIDDAVRFVNAFYDRLTTTLNYCANSTIPRMKKNALKFWWSQELDCLKVKSIETDRAWKQAGKPRSGELHRQRTVARTAYRAAIKKAQKDEITSYTNDLHEALLQKRGQQFWKCWNSKFNIQRPVHLQIDGSVDSQLIANKFADHFVSVCTPLTQQGSDRLKREYQESRLNYVGDLNEQEFDVELVDHVIREMSKGKAAGVDNLTAEHLQYCHPILPLILSRLFNLCVHYRFAPLQFGLSYTVPLLKNTSVTKQLTVDDFRGISISPIISKIFEHCLLERYMKYFGTSDNQFGFKKLVGCPQAIYCARKIVENYVSYGSTVNLCALDISKAFDKMNHYGLFLKLMSRHLPVNILSLLEFWFQHCYTCVKWQGAFSSYFVLNCGIRQGGVLSPYLFAVYINSVISKVENSYLGCRLGLLCCSIIMFADDIILLSPSVTSLQSLLHICETELGYLELAINSKKSYCLRVGPRYSVNCVNLVSLSGNVIKWVSVVRYLGVYIRSARTFRCCFDSAKRSFFGSFNSIYGKIGGTTSEEVIIHLINTKCLPALLYSTEAIPLTKSDLKSLDFTFKRLLFKIFRTSSVDIVNDACTYFCISPVSDIIDKRQHTFMTKLRISDNQLLFTMFHSPASLI